MKALKNAFQRNGTKNFQVMRGWRAITFETCKPHLISIFNADHIPSPNTYALFWLNVRRMRPILPDEKDDIYATAIDKLLFRACGPALQWSHFQVITAQLTPGSFSDVNIMVKIKWNFEFDYTLFFLSHGFILASDSCRQLPCCVITRVFWATVRVMLHRARELPNHMMSVLYVSRNMHPFWTCFERSPLYTSNLAYTISELPNTRRTKPLRHFIIVLLTGIVRRWQSTMRFSAPRSVSPSPVRG